MTVVLNILKLYAVYYTIIINVLNFVFRVNANVDLVVNGTELLRQLKVEPGIKHDHALLHTIAHLQETFHFSLSKGAAIERYFTDPDIFLEITQGATELEEMQVAASPLLIVFQI